MTSASTKSHNKSASQQIEASARDPVRPTTERHVVLALQAAAGNRAVAGLLDGSSGKPLDPTTRVEMESKFGTDFADVRVHTGNSAAATALAAGARALTKGRDIFFGDGYFSPGSRTGKRLLAHELAHVIQQSRLGGRNISATAAETEARAAGADVAAGQAATVQASTSAGAQADPMSEEERRRRDTEMMASPQLLASLQQMGLAPPSTPPQAPAKPSELEIQEPGLADYLQKNGFGPPAAPTPAPMPKPVPFVPKPKDDYPTILRQPPAQEGASEDDNQQSLEEMEGQLFGVGNSQASQNLAQVIEGIGGRSYDTSKMSREDLLAEYYRLKSGPNLPPPPANMPVAELPTPGGVPVAELDRQRALWFENLNRYTHEPGAWMATGAFAMGKSPDEVSGALNDAQTLTGLAIGLGGVAAAQAPMGTTGQPIESEPPEPEEWGPDESAPPELETRGPAAPKVEAQPAQSAMDQPAIDQTPVDETAVSQESLETPAEQTPTEETPAGPSASFDQSTLQTLSSQWERGAANTTGLEAYWRRAEQATVSTIAAENPGAPVIDLNQVSKPNFAGVDVLSESELASVKAYTGNTAMERYRSDLQEISGGKGPTGVGAKSFKTATDIGRLQAQIEVGGGSLPLPADYQKDPEGFIQQNTVLRVPDDHVEELQNSIVQELTDPANPYGYQDYGLDNPVTEDQAREFAARRVKGVGATSEELLKP